MAKMINFVIYITIKKINVTIFLGIKKKKKKRFLQKKRRGVLNIGKKDSLRNSEDLTFKQSK